MKSAALFVFFCVRVYAQPAAIEGVAVHAVTGQPIAGVHVRLFAGSAYAVSEAYGAMSDSSGHFSLARIPAGTYVITAERTGFVYTRKTPVAGPSTSLALKSGERVTDLKLELSPRATIAGHVVDEYGDPVPGVSVTLEAVSKESSLGTGMVGGMNFSDDHGEFRLRAAPGKYRVRATPREMYYTSAADIDPDGANKKTYGPTYFPSATRPDQASIVDAATGAELNGIEIRLSQHSGSTISGVVTGIPENSMTTIMLQSGESPGRVNRSRGMGVQRDGKFRFSSMDPGYYRIFAFQPSARPPLQSPALEFKLEGGDVSNLQLALAPGGEITGTLEFAGGSAPPGKRTIRLTADLQFGKQPSGEVDQEGSFHIAGVLPDKYRLHVDALPENAYIQNLQMDGAAITNGVLDFSSGVHDTKLKIKVGRNGGQISGTVVEKDGQHINSPAATVYLLQDPEDLRRQQPARVTAEGKYSFKALRPGKYRLFAIDPRGVGRSADGLQQLFKKAEEIEIKEGDRITKDLKVEEGNATH